MGLSQISKPKELWEVVVAKDGRRFENMLRCTDVNALDVDEPELSNFLSEKLDAWLKEDPKKNDELLNKLGKDGGFSVKFSDGNTYKMVKYQGQMQVTKIKPGSGGGWKKGGSYTFLRTETFRIGGADVVAEVINNQQPGDNWKITKIAGDSLKNMIFQMENQKQYTPNAAAAETKKTEKESDTDEEGESE